MAEATNRLVKYSISRIAADATTAAGDVGFLAGGSYGSTDKISGGEILYGINDGYGPAGMDRYWNGTFEINDLTWDIFDMLDDPDSLGPGVYAFEVYRTTNDDLGKKVTRVRQYKGTFRQVGTGTSDRTTDSERNLVFAPFLRIDGADDTDGNGKDLSENNARLYADTRKGILKTNSNGTKTDWMADFEAAHGITEAQLPSE